MAGKNEISITFETLYELLRKEKHKEEIQPLSKTFFEDVVEYLRERRAEISNAPEQLDLITAAKQGSHRNQIETIVQVLTEFYNRRERKLMSMALNKVRTGSDIVDTSSLMEEEKQLLHSMISLLTTYREGILHAILRGNVPDIDKQCHEKPSPQQASNAQHQQAPGNTISKAPEATDGGQDQGSRASHEQPNGLKTIRFLKPVPKFTGKELEVYGPFNEEDVANLPRDIADLLLRKGRAEEIDQA